MARSLLPPLPKYAQCTKHLEVFHLCIPHQNREEGAHHVVASGVALLTWAVHGWFHTSCVMPRPSRPVSLLTLRSRAPKTAQDTLCCMHKWMLMPSLHSRTTPPSLPTNAKTHGTPNDKQPSSTKLHQQATPSMNGISLACIRVHLRTEVKAKPTCFLTMTLPRQLLGLRRDSKALQEAAAQATAAIAAGRQRRMLALLAAQTASLPLTLTLFTTGRGDHRTAARRLPHLRAWTRYIACSATQPHLQPQTMR